MHADFAQGPLLAVHEKLGILTGAWSPLGRGRLLENPVVQRIAARHGRSGAQVLLRWIIDRGAVPIPKSAHPERMRANLHSFDFQLTADDMRDLATLDSPTTAPAVIPPPMWRNNATPPFMPAAPAGRRAGLHKRGPGCYGAPPVPRAGVLARPPWEHGRHERDHGTTWHQPRQQRHLTAAKHPPHRLLFLPARRAVAGAGAGGHAGRLCQQWPSRNE
ncbi:aldo/keto reductase [Komagataeibacter rhaeticus]|nr:aldo/keto reductase [Komagataeibacter rhaeticus]